MTSSQLLLGFLILLAEGSTSRHVTRTASHVLPQLRLEKLDFISHFVLEQGVNVLAYREESLQSYHEKPTDDGCPMKTHT
jgi:hypothetical protein